MLITPVWVPHKHAAHNIFIHGFVWIFFYVELSSSRLSSLKNLLPTFYNESGSAQVSVAGLGSLLDSDFCKMYNQLCVSVEPVSVRRV